MNEPENDASLVDLFSYWVINKWRIQTKVYFIVTSLALSGMIIQSWVYPTGVVIQYLNGDGLLWFWVWIAELVIDEKDLNAEKKDEEGLEGERNMLLWN